MGPSLTSSASLCAGVWVYAMVKESKAMVKVLAAVLYEVINHKVSVDVAFKRACKGRCASRLEERETLYSMARKLVSDYLKVTCVIGRRKSFAQVVRLWLKGIDAENTPPWCRLSYTEWFYNMITSLLGVEEGEKLLEAMNGREWWLRINTLKAPEERVFKELDDEGVVYEVDKHFSYMVKVISSPKPIRLLKPVKEFKAVPQDKASAAVVEALAPNIDDEVIDMAYAPGMKTSLIMQLTENRAKVTAIDLSYRRALLGYGLLKRLGVDLSRVNIISADARDLRFKRKFDKVLLDAPCSNSGAVSKDPGIKINLTPSKVQYYSGIQKGLIRRAIELGDVIVYSTCSLMPEEGEHVIAEVADQVKLERVFTWASKGYGVVSFSSDLMRFFPHKHRTEGFFLARLTA